MALTNGVHIRTRGLSAGWNSRKESLQSVVRLGLENDGYIVLTLDDSTSLAAQVCGAMLALPLCICGMPHAMTSRFGMHAGRPSSFR
jgi:hypothetical protein